MNRRARHWWQDAVVYQVYPRSFADSDGDGIGDLPGILGRLPYLRSLGVDALWISPFFRSPMLDFGYDISDHTAVDPIFGTDADAGALIAAAHAHGLRILIDIWSNPAVRAAQLEVLRWWLDRGVDGVRRDSINRLGKDPAYRDNVAGEPSRQQDWPALHGHLRQVRALVDAYPGAVVVGEVWEFDQRRILPYLAPGELHLAHNFVFARAPFDATGIRRTVEEFTELAGPDTWPAWFLNNHDEPRVRSRWSTPGDDDEVRCARARLAAVLLLTLRGTPFLYQGEELGLPDTELPPGVGEDRNGRDPQRTPMPWAPPSTAGPGAGFTTGTPWLPIGSTAEQLNVASELHDRGSMLNLYRHLLGLRRNRPSLRAGDQVFLDVPRDVLAYLRTEAGECSLVVLNLAAATRSLDLAPVIGPGWSSTPALLAWTGGAAAVPGPTLVLAPFSGAVLDPGPAGGPRP